MYIVGLTGGIGSGKTAVSDRFEALGISIVDADLCSRVVVEKGRPALKQIAEYFGPSVIDDNGELNRAELRKIIFSDSDKKKWLEALLHPLIAEETINQLSSAKSAYVILVSPLLVEAQQYLMCNDVIVVDVPEATQLERTMARDSNDAEQVKSIMASQASRNKRLEHASIVIENTAGLDKLDKEVNEIHQGLLTKAHEHNSQQPA